MGLGSMGPAVAWVTVFSTLAGLIYGAWVDGASVQSLSAYLVVGLIALALGLSQLSKRRKRRTVVSAEAPAE